MTLREFSYPSHDGVHTIQAREWQPEGQPPAVLQLVHGLAEHIGRYDHVARFFSDRGFLVCGEDHLGHGRTAEGGLYGFFAARNGWDTVLRDVHRLRELEGQRYPELPYFILGHSMGSFLTRTYLIQYPGSVTGAVLSGTGQEPAPVVALGKTLSGLLSVWKGPTHTSRLLLALSLGSYNRPFRPNRTPSDWISRDCSMVDASLQDPYCNFCPTVSLFHDMAVGLQRIGNPKELSKMDRDTPVYFFSGDCDPVGSMGKGVEKTVKRFRSAGCRDVTCKLYPGGRHEMFNEINRQDVMEDLLLWLNSKLVLY